MSGVPGSSVPATVPEPRNNETICRMLVADLSHACDSCRTHFESLKMYENFTDKKNRITRVALWTRGSRALYFVSLFREVPVVKSVARRHSDCHIFLSQAGNIVGWKVESRCWIFLCQIYILFIWISNGFQSRNSDSSWMYRSRSVKTKVFKAKSKKNVAPYLTKSSVSIAKS